MYHTIQDTFLDRKFVDITLIGPKIFSIQEWRGAQIFLLSFWKYVNINTYEIWNSCTVGILVINDTVLSYIHYIDHIISIVSLIQLNICHIFLVVCFSCSTFPPFTFLCSNAPSLHPIFATSGKELALAYQKNLSKNKALRSVHLSVQPSVHHPQISYNWYISFDHH